MDPDEDEPPRVEKLYCCGNSSQKEALYVSRCDLGLAIFKLLCLLSFSIVFAGKEELLNGINTTGRLADLRDFLEFPAYVQWIALVTANIMTMGEICLAILLTYAAQQRNISFLKIWFGLVLLETLAVIGFHAYCATWSRAKILHIVYPVALFLYEWYAMWICVVLIRRTRAIQSGYENPSIEDPDGDYTISIQPPVSASAEHHHTPHHPNHEPLQPLQQEDKL